MESVQLHVWPAASLSESNYDFDFPPSSTVYSARLLSQILSSHLSRVPITVPGTGKSARNNRHMVPGDREPSSASWLPLLNHSTNIYCIPATAKRLFSTPKMQRRLTGGCDSQLPGLV